MTENKPHLLYVAWGYPPARGSGVYRAVATPNEFAARGWRVTVVTADRESFAKYTGADTSLENLIDPRVRVIRVPFRRPYLEDDVGQWSLLRTYFGYPWLALQVIREQLAFPEPRYGFWLPALRRAVRAIHAAEPVDLVMGTANPFVDMAGAASLHSRGVPYILDHRDAWQLNTFTGARVTRAGGRVDRIERRLFREAAEVWFVNQPILRWHAGLYPESAEKMREVPNGADGEFEPRTPRGDRPIRFTYVGTITSQVPVAQLGEGWALADSRGDLDDAEGHLYGYVGFFNREDSPEQRALTRAVEISRLEYLGPAPKADLPAIYRDSDVLLLAMGGAEYITSGKTYEYLATGLPIVSVHDPRSAASEVLADYPLWFPAASLAPADIADALAAAAREVRDPDPERWRKAAAGAHAYQRTVLLAPHIDRLREQVRST